MSPKNIHARNHYSDSGEMFSRTLIPLDQKFTKPLESYESKQNEKILQSCNKTSLGHETCGKIFFHLCSTVTILLLTPPDSSCFKSMCYKVL